MKVFCDKRISLQPGESGWALLFMDTIE
jgi:hypothetical protein